VHIVDSCNMGRSTVAGVLIPNSEIRVWISRGNLRDGYPFHSGTPMGYGFVAGQLGGIDDRPVGSWLHCYGLLDKSEEHLSSTRSFFNASMDICAQPLHTLQACH